MKHKSYYLLLILIFALGFFLRFYKLGEVPFGFYQDESAIGYNAYSIMQTGKDEHGVSFPLYFKSFGDYKLPVYIYTTIIPIKLFGMNEFAVRFPSAFFGFLSLIVFFLFVKELTKNKNLSLIATALLSINPWSLDYNRATFEVSISLFLFLLGGYLLLLFWRKGTKTAFLFGTICFIASLYSYNLTRLLAPVLYIIFLFYGKQRKTFYKSHAVEIAITGIVSFVLLIPFFVTFLTQGGVSSAAGTFLFTSNAVKAPLIETRSYFLQAPWIIQHVVMSTPVLLLWQYALNIFSYLSVEFFFITGSMHGNHGIGDVGEFYLFELITMTLGIVFAYKKQTTWKNILVLWAISTILIASLTRDIPQATRSFFLIAPVEIFSAYGLMIFWSFLLRIKRRYIFYVVLTTVVGFSLYCIVFYFASYYGRFPVLYASSWRQQDKAVSLYIKAHEAKYERIIIDSDSGFIYSSLLFYLQYPPKEFQDTVVWLPDDSEGMTRPLQFGKYEFRPIDWTTDFHAPHTLLITTADKKPPQAPAIETFFYPERPVVVSIKEQLSNFIVHDIAYEAVESQ